MIRALITGCHGLLGQKLVEKFGPQFGEIHGIDVHEKSFFEGLVRFKYHRADLTDRETILGLVNEIKPKVIINTAAMTNVDACEADKKACRAINTDAVATLVEAAERNNSKLIQVSTDYVFNGEAGPYSELDIPDPISEYGRSKRDSEIIMQESGIDHVIIRTMVLFGLGRNLRPNFVSWLVCRLRDGHQVKIVTDQMGNITLVDDLAVAIRRIALLNKSGLYHVAGREIVSRFEFAEKVAIAYQLDASLLRPTLTRLLGQAAPRPLQSGLIVDKAQDELNLKFFNVDEALKVFREQEATLN